MSKYKFDWSGFTKEDFTDYCAKMENGQLYADDYVGCVRTGELCFDLVLRLYPYAQIGRDGLAAAPETIAALSAPETDAPETAPPETEPETEAAVVLPLEPEPAETTLEEWFAIVEARVKPRAYEPEEPDPDETTLDEWIEAHRAAAAADKRYKVNTKTKTIHAKDDCYAAKRIKSENVDYVADPYPLLADGYEWCGICH
jgi:hypothetical protein